MKYKHLVSRVSSLLFDADPIGINFEANTDEYDAEAASIVRRLHEAGSVEALQQIIHEEFVRWFDQATAGPLERYRPIAESIWSLSASVESDGGLT
jgi:biotin-(acetyl-CoA carboxylase) ligase